jgi:hypothetical protein
MQRTNKAKKKNIQNPKLILEEIKNRKYEFISIPLKMANNIIIKYSMKLPIVLFIIIVL